MAPLQKSETSDDTMLNLLSVQIRLLQFASQWPINCAEYLPRPVKFLSPFFSKVFQVLSAVIAGHIFLLLLKATYDLFGGNLADLAEMCTVCFVYFFDVFLIVYLQWRHDLLRETIDLMNTNFRRRSAKGLTYTSTTNAYLRAKRFAIFWISSCVTGSMLWALYPLTLQERNLPLKCWYPFDENQPVVYEILYIVQFIAQAQLGIAFPNGGCLYVSLIIIICGQYDILFCSLKNFTYNAELESKGVTRSIRQSQRQLDLADEEVSQYYCSQEYYEDFSSLTPATAYFDSNAELLKKEALQASVKNCVQHHLTILEACNKMESIFNPICLIKSLQAMFQLCFMAFFVLNANASPFRMMNFGQYFFLSVVELTLYTYFGEILSNHSVRVVDAIARSQWFAEGHVVKKDLSIILANSQMPVKLTAGKLSVMDIEKWKMVMKSAFSFFTLLQHLK